MRFTLLFPFILSSFFIYAQETDTRNMSVKDNNLAQNFSVLTHEILIKPKNELIYSYFRDEKLFRTQGSFSGWLLHGKYESFYNDKMLESQGYYQYGLKNGEWKHWHTNGFLKLVETWRKGVKIGYFEEYNDKGYIIRSGNYKDGYISGKVLVYNEKREVIQVLNYKKGVLLEPKTKKVTLAAAQNKQ